MCSHKQCNQKKRSLLPKTINQTSHIQYWYCMVLLHLVVAASQSQGWGEICFKWSVVWLVAFVTEKVFITQRYLCPPINLSIDNYFGCDCHGPVTTLSVIYNPCWSSRAGNSGIMDEERYFSYSLSMPSFKFIQKWCLATLWHRCNHIAPLHLA